MPDISGKLTHVERAGSKLPTMLSGYLEDMQVEHITSHAMWTDPYVSQRNLTSTILTDAMRPLTNDFQERSPVEEVAIQIIVDELLNEVIVERIVNQMRILYRYHVHCNIGRIVLRS